MTYIIYNFFIDTLQANPKETENMHLPLGFSTHHGQMMHNSFSLENSKY